MKIIRGIIVAIFLILLRVSLDIRDLYYNKKNSKK